MLHLRPRWENCPCLSQLLQYIGCLIISLRNIRRLWRNAVSRNCHDLSFHLLYVWGHTNSTMSKYEPNSFIISFLSTLLKLFILFIKFTFILQNVYSNRVKRQPTIDYLTDVRITEYFPTNPDSSIDISVNQLSDRVLK